MTQAHLMMMIAGMAALIAVYAWFAERRRKNRRDLDDVGLIPWTLVLLCSVIVAIVGGYYAAKLSGAPAIKMRRRSELQIEPMQEREVRTAGTQAGSIERV